MIDGMRVSERGQNSQAHWHFSHWLEGLRWCSVNSRVERGSQNGPRLVEKIVHVTESDNILVLFSFWCHFGLRPLESVSRCTFVYGNQQRYGVPKRYEITWHTPMIYYMHTVHVLILDYNNVIFSLHWGNWHIFRGWHGPKIDGKMIFQKW